MRLIRNSGFFGVAPGTSETTNPNMIAAIAKNTIFTNVALTPEQDVWWEGLTDTPPPELIDWQGQQWTPDCGRKAAHPNARFTVSITQCPVLDSEWENPAGVPIDALIFGGRRANVVPLIYEAADWQQGVYTAATTSSETTAAAAGRTGVVRHDPMAMLPFCGYNMGDYFQHWLDIGKNLRHPPKIFRVNWFRKGVDGRFLWPGFKENMRILVWILDRIAGKVNGVAAKIGLLPNYQDMVWAGLDEIDAECFAKLIQMDKESWLSEVHSHQEFFAKFGTHLPAEFLQISANLKSHLSPCGRDHRGRSNKN